MSAGVVVFEDPAFGAERARVVAACARLGMSCRSADDENAAEVADYAVAFLPPGERRVPRNALRALASRGDRTPLLLLSRERLTQPTMWLEGSLLVLMGDSPTETAIASRLRMLDASATDRERGDFLVREVRRPRFFAATFSNYADQMPGPKMVERAGEWTALLPLDEVASATGTSSSDSGRGSEESCGVLRFGTRDGVFVGDVPTGWGSLTMASPRRAPASTGSPAAPAETSTPRCGPRAPICSLRCRHPPTTCSATRRSPMRSAPEPAPCSSSSSSAAPS